MYLKTLLIITISVSVVCNQELKFIFPLEIWLRNKGEVYDVMIPIKNIETNTSGPYRQNQFTNMKLRNNGCSCQSLICNCCLDFNISQLNFQRTGCMKLTADPVAFAIKFGMIWEDEEIYKFIVSGKNPPPVCFPLPIPYIPGIDACARIFEISVLPESQKVHACLDLEARIQRASVLLLHFDCVQIGRNSTLNFVKPTPEPYKIQGKKIYT